MGKNLDEMDSGELKGLIEAESASVPEEVDLTPIPQQEINESERQAQFAQAYVADMADLHERYGEPVNEFERDFNSGRFRAPAGLEKTENALEVGFLAWLGQHASEFDSDYLGAVLPRRDDMGDLEDEEKTIPLRSRSAAILNPQGVRPARERRVEKTIKMPDLSLQDVNEMVSDWAKKHPERFR